MKNRVFLPIAACALALSAHAAVFEFDLGGPAGPGLRGGNEVPPSGSPATGEEAPLSGVGLQYNDATQTLDLHVGWGAAAVGGVDLTSDFVRATLNGPATTSQTAPELYIFNSPATGYGEQGSPRSGFVDYSLPLTDQGGYTVAQQEADLKNGLWYFNVVTTGFPAGEIRGQLTPVPEPATYGLIAGVGLLGFAGYRRFKAAQVTLA